MSDIGNLDEIEEDEVNISAASQDTSAKISELASKFGLLDTNFSDDPEESKWRHMISLLMAVTCIATEIFKHLFSQKTMNVWN